MIKGLTKVAEYYGKGSMSRSKLKCRLGGVSMGELQQGGRRYWPFNSSLISLPLPASSALLSYLPGAQWLCRR